MIVRSLRMLSSATLAAVLVGTSPVLSAEIRHVMRDPLALPPPAPAVSSPAGEAASPPPPDAVPGQLARSEMSVLVDRAKVIRLPARTQTVVVGNPAIADVAVQRNGVVVLTGKSYGSTNMIALDGAGGMLAESLVTVTPPTDAMVVVQRGFLRQSYSCNPNCLPTVTLGDEKEYFNEVKGQADIRNQFATGR